MKLKTETYNLIELKYIKPVYMMLIFLMALTGFAQMPIFKRYYIADIPGLGWLAQFYVTHHMHYIGAILLLALFIYVGVIYWAMMRQRLQLTRSAVMRIAFLFGIVVTGVLRVLKNLPNVVFSPEFTMFIDISHLGFMMMFLMVAAISSITRRGWLRETNRYE